jgi:hypothetical protein
VSRGLKRLQTPDGAYIRVTPELVERIKREET